MACQLPQIVDRTLHSTLLQLYTIQERSRDEL